MLPPELRLRLDSDIKMLFAKGKGIFDVGLGLRYRPNHLKVSRFAIVVGVKVSKKAVVRNRLRRQVRSFLEHERSDIQPGFDVLIMLRPQTKDYSRADLFAALSRILKKSPVFK